MIKSLLSYLLLGLLLSVAAGLFGWQALNRYLDAPMDIQEPFEYQLQRGGSLNSVMRWMSAEGHIQYPKLITLYSRISGLGQQVQAGEYAIKPGMTARHLLEKMSRGEVIEYPVTLVEGWTLKQALSALSAQAGLGQSQQSSLEAFIVQLTASYPAAEGLFFPDTYYYFRGLEDVDVLKQSYDRMQAILARQWQSRAENLPYQSPYEALIMASLIEKETGVGYERGQIAGVFVRRLQQNMRLQTDPTVIYGLGDSFNGNLRSKHLKDASNPYNTYRHHGLPPTPIALPGEEAIYAALHPEPGEALYFVARGDGSHYFSATLEEHNRAVRKYQINQRKKNYSSSPKR